MKALCYFCIIILQILCIGDLAAQPTFESHLISDATQSTESLYIIDLDNDGDQDILGAAAEYDHDVIWWRNDGGDPVQWTKIIIDGNFQGAGAIYAADLNNDSLTDIIAGAKLGNQVAWWENGGGNPVNWTKRVIQFSYIFPHELFATDLNLDGNMDILAASSGLNEITWWENCGGNPVIWTRQVISQNFPQAKSVHCGDFNNDGLPDVVGASLTGNQIFWWKNNGGIPIQWSEYPVTANLAGAHRVQAIDLDKDGRVDILGTGYYANEIAWWRNEGADPIIWTKQVIASNFPRACVALAIDLDNDNRIDVIGTSQNGNRVEWWRNEGGDPIAWTKYTIDGDFYRVWPLCAGDLDRDGDIDVVAASGVEGNYEVRWYENNLVVGMKESGNSAINNEKVEVFPNPVSNILNIYVPGTGKESVQIDLFTVAERKIINLFSGKLDHVQKLIKIPVPELPVGLYLLKIYTDSKAYCEKIIIRR
jgi:hypothetical protein